LSSTEVKKGRELDAETGLFYYRARYFSPELGRFLARDPLEANVNLYSYCSDGPQPAPVRQGYNVLMRDGSVRFITEGIDPVVAQQLQDSARAASGPYLAAPPPPQPARAEQSTPTTPQDCIGFWDWVQGGLDAGGLIDPTPVCDGLSTVISLFRG